MRIECSTAGRRRHGATAGWSGAFLAAAITVAVAACNDSPSEPGADLPPAGAIRVVVEGQGLPASTQIPVIVRKGEDLRRAIVVLGDSVTFGGLTTGSWEVIANVPTFIEAIPGTSLRKFVEVGEGPGFVVRFAVRIGGG